MKKQLTIFLSIMLLTVMVFGMLNSAIADTMVTRVQTGSRGASLRSSPEKTDDNKIGSVHENTVLEVLDEKNGWYYVYHNGQYGWVASTMVTVTETKNTRSSNNSNSSYSSGNTGYSTGNAGYSSGNSYDYNQPYDMGIPQIGSTVYQMNMMNMTVFWVQTQLKATGIWYQGEYWDVTGNLGDHTMEEISSFMASRGYPGHSGVVDQQVINTIAAYMGNRIQPVYVGGFYDSMNTIMIGGSAGSMYQITSNLRDNVPRESVGARWVQCVLKGLGYYTSGIDGKYGEGTENAVKKFQREHGFQERDYVSLGVARAMLEQYYYSGCSLMNLP